MNYINIDNILFVFGAGISCLFRFELKTYKITTSRYETISFGNNVKRIIYIGSENDETTIAKIKKYSLTEDITIINRDFVRLYHNKCILCYDNNSIMTNVPCGHRILCLHCFQMLRSEEHFSKILERCNICRSTISCLTSIENLSYSN